MKKYHFQKKLLTLQEGQIRYDNLIPPGFRDSAKVGEAKYGDLFVWKDIIAIAKEKNTNIIFVCNDTKEDWWEKNKDIPIKNSSCIYLDYARHNAIELYKLTNRKLDMDDAKKSVSAGNIRNLYNTLEYYNTCKSNR